MSRQVRQQQDKFIIRLPDGMRDKIEAVAKENKRTMTGEIIARLERTFEEDDARTKGALDVIQASPSIKLEKLRIEFDLKIANAIEKIEKRLAELENKKHIG